MGLIFREPRFLENGVVGNYRLHFMPILLTKLVTNRQRTHRTDYSPEVGRSEGDTLCRRSGEMIHFSNASTSRCLFFHPFLSVQIRGRPFPHKKY